MLEVLTESVIVMEDVCDVEADMLGDDVLDTVIEEVPVIEGVNVDVGVFVKLTLGLTVDVGV